MATSSGELLPGKLALGILLAVGVGCLVWQMPAGGPILSNDSYQYLDAAANVASGKCFCTDVAYFDEQVLPGHFPVPFTHFAPGFPLLIAALSKLGIAPEIAGYSLSICGFLASLFLFWQLSRELRIGAGLGLMLGLIWATQKGMLTSATWVSTEALFIPTMMAVVALIAWDLRARQAALLPLVALAAGFAYWVRYPGLFLIPVAGLYLLWRGWRERQYVWAGGSLALLAALMLFVQLRNIHYTGSWKGGFSSTGHSNSIKTVLVETGKAAFHLIFGDRVVAKLDVWTGLFAAAVVLLFALALRGWRQSSGKPGNYSLLFWYALLGCSYCGGILLATLTTIAADFTRYYLPVYPFALLLVGAFIARIPATRLRAVAICALVVPVLIVQSRSLFAAPAGAPHALVSRILSEEVDGGASARQWLISHAAPNEALIAVNGQALHYLLQRPVVGLIFPDETSRKEDEQGIRALMSKFHARYLIVFPGMTEEMDEQKQIPFLSALAAGVAHPEWLTIATRGKSIAVWECGACVR